MKRNKKERKKERKKENGNDQRACSARDGHWNKFLFFPCFLQNPIQSMPIISGWRGVAWRQRTTKFGLQIVINTTGRGAHTRLCNEETFKTRKRFIKGRIMKHTNTRNKERKRRREGGSLQIKNNSYSYYSLSLESKQVKQRRYVNKGMKYRRLSLSLAKCR